MIVGIGAILFLLICAYAAVALRAQSRHLLSMITREAELVGAVADRAIANAMEAGRGDEVQAILERVGEQPDLARIRVLDAAGVIRRSSRPAEVGQQATALDHLLRPDARRPPESAVHWDVEKQHLDTMRPIMNRTTCHGCHDARQTTLGYVAVTASLPAIDSEMAEQLTILVLAALVVLVVAGVLIWLLFTVLVGSRIDALAGSMSLVEAGDLHVRAPARGRDELARLGESFNAMVARLADARQQLESRHAEEIRRAEHLAALGKMAAGVAHEINNPLAGMQNCVRTLLKGGRDAEQRAQYLGMLEDGLARIARIVSHLLNFAREARPQLAPTRLGPVLQRCLTLVEHEVAARGITVSVAPDSNLPPVLADVHQIEQLFLNILMNAVEAMPRGGRLDIAVGSSAQDGRPALEVRVTDTGTGITADQLSRIFDPFFTTKDVGKGTGLGLSVSYGIVRAHGGSIAVSSTVGAGSTFTVLLPIAHNGDRHA
jgi:two-component system NtrC family sensor kinase